MPHRKVSIRDRNDRFPPSPDIGRVAGADVRFRPIADIGIPAGAWQFQAMNASKTAGAIVIIAVLGAWAYIAAMDEPQLPINTANGSYSNRCCGTILIENGVMRVADTSVSYGIGQDKVSPYVLPKAYVGASDRGFVVRSGSYALKLRLDGRTRPQKIELIDDVPGSKAYPFARANVR